MAYMNGKYFRELIMSKEDVMEIVKMRCEEKSWIEIGKLLNRDVTSIQNELYDILFSRRSKRRTMYETPLSKWMFDNQVRLVDLAKKTGYTNRTLYSVMSNKYRVGQDVLDCISEVTGIPANGFYPNGMPERKAKGEKGCEKL